MQRSTWFKLKVKCISQLHMTYYVLCGGALSFSSLSAPIKSDVWEQNCICFRLQLSIWSFKYDAPKEEAPYVLKPFSQFRHPWNFLLLFRNCQTEKLHGEEDFDAVVDNCRTFPRNTENFKKSFDPFLEQQQMKFGICANPAAVCIWLQWLPQSGIFLLTVCSITFETV